MEPQLRWQHKARARRTTQAGRYSTSLVAKLFGTTDNRVREWIASGYLVARRYKLAGNAYYVIDGNALIRFLHVRGGVMNFEPTTTEWKKQKERGRQHILATTLTTQEVADLLIIKTGHLPWLKRKHGFPDPCIILWGSKGSNRYRKLELAKWLDTHPQYDQGGLRREQLRCI